MSPLVSLEFRGIRKFSETDATLELTLHAMSVHFMFLESSIRRKVGRTFITVLADV